MAVWLFTVILMFTMVDCLIYSIHYELCLRLLFCLHLLFVYSYGFVYNYYLFTIIICHLVYMEKKHTSLMIFCLLLLFVLIGIRSHLWLKEVCGASRVLFRPMYASPCFAMDVLIESRYIPSYINYDYDIDQYFNYIPSVYVQGIGIIWLGSAMCPDEWF